MRRIALTSTAVALALALVGLVSIAAAPAAKQSVKSRTLSFDVRFSPFTLVRANPVRDPNSPFALGDEITFHDLLLSKGMQVGDEVGSCVLVAVTPEVLANCSDVMRLPGGNISAQFASAPVMTIVEIDQAGGWSTGAIITP